MNKLFIRKIVVIIATIVIAGFIGQGLFANGGGEKDGSSKDAGGAFLFKYSNSQNKEHPRTQSMMFFKEELEAKSQGRIKVEIYDSGVLGNEKEQFDQLNTGIIQGYRGAYYELLSEKYYLYNVPFLFSDADQVIKFSNSDFMKQVNQEASAKGAIYIPAVGSSGFRNIVNNVRPLTKPSDFKGINFRSPSQLPIIEFYKALGANPQEMPSSEVYLALNSGVIDGACSSNADLDTWKVAEVAKYLTVIHYTNGADPFMVNKKWYESLPDDLKKIFDEVSVATMTKSDELRKEGEKVALENLKKDIAEVNFVEGPVREEFKKELKPVWDLMISKGYFSQADLEEAQKALQ